jgi:DNA-binding MarR family transcriptional regulator
MTKYLGMPTDFPHEHLSVDEALTRLVSIQARTVALFVERRTERQDGSPTRMQRFVLRTIAERGPLTVSQLADTLSVSAPTASQVVNTLVERGWLKVELSARDRRRHDVHITSAGTQLLANQTRKRLRNIQTILEQLTPEERTQLVYILDRVVTLWQSSEGSSENGR